MIAKCIKDIIEPMGFINEGDSNEERWVAQFLCDDTGNILTVILVESADEYGVRKILFDICDEDGVTVNTITFDQMLMSFERDLEMIPKKSNKSYICVYNVRVQVAVDMGEVPEHLFNNYIREGYMTELEIAEQCARTKLRRCFAHADMNIINFECEQTEC